MKTLNYHGYTVMNCKRLTPLKNLSHCCLECSRCILRPKGIFVYLYFPKGQMNVVKSLLSLVSCGILLAKSIFDIIFACPAFPSISSREGNQGSVVVNTKSNTTIRLGHRYQWARPCRITWFYYSCFQQGIYFIFHFLS